MKRYSYMMATTLKKMKRVYLENHLIKKFFILLKLVINVDTKPFHKNVKKQGKIIIAI
jgi:hypothetical protein